MKNRNALPKRLLWLDLEMTGIDPNTKGILEVAAIVTDFDFKEYETYEAVVKQPQKVLDNSDAWVKEHLGKNGLFEKVKEEGIDEEKVQKDICALIDKHFDSAAIIAGSSIHQDRRFIRQWWPLVEPKLHYRMLDVTSLKVYMMGKHKFYMHKRELHRALDDVRGSIEEFKTYLEKIHSQDL